MIISAQAETAVAPLPRLSAMRQRLSHALWHSRSIRAQLLIVFVVIDFFAVLVAGGVTILRARAQARVEIAASMHLAEFLVSDAVHLAQQQVPAEQFLAALPVQLRSIRHVRIAVADAAGVPVAPPSAADAANGALVERSPAPAWFRALVASPIEMHEVPVTINGARIGEVEIIGEPGDEIAEVWENAVALGIVALVVNVTMIGILYVLFGRVLDPLTVLASGLSDLERRTYSVRLPRPKAHELAAIADRFNALALALETVRAENLRLNRRLITAQDDERRRTALELHDEVGPCLFGLKANATSIASAVRDLPNRPRDSVIERTQEILSIIDHLQMINRSMLDRLRPMALGHVPLCEILCELVHERARQHPQTSFAYTAAQENLKASYGDSIDLTIYRCIQESLTNAIRHAKPKHVTVDIGETDGGARLQFTVSDDGNGMKPDTPAGFGLRGMRERVEGLGGRYILDSEPSRGTCVRVTIPLNEPRTLADNAEAIGTMP